jgi:excisionase family DNA binding protein
MNRDRIPRQGLLSYREAAKYLGVTERTLWTLVNSGDLPAVRFRRTVRIDPADLRMFIEKSKRGGRKDGDWSR